jgi:NTE family protein
MSEGSLNGDHRPAGSNGRRPPASKVAVVLPGGGARGAYEVGALEALLPALQARGEQVSVWCGTSVGAINAAAMASRAHLPAGEQVAQVAEVWNGLRKRDVLSRLVGPGGMRMLLRALGHGLGVPNVGLASLFDPSPLAASVDRWIDWDALARNLRRGNIDAVCIVATMLATGQPVGFVDSRGEMPANADQTLRYVKTRLRGEHVRASAAIPVLFPTVQVTTPRSAHGHYTDGGTRLNSAIKPAIDLGADKVIVIGFEPFVRRPGARATAREPSIADVVANVLDGLLVDQVANDLRRLAAINSFFVEAPSTGPGGSARTYRIARGHAPYRLVSYALVAPRRRGEIARLAEATFERRYGGLRGLRDIDFAVIARALGTATRSRGEFLSFLLFDHEFALALMELGRRDAQRWLRRHPHFWCRDASHDLSLGQLERSRVIEQEAIEEFRAHRRH